MWTHRRSGQSNQRGEQDHRAPYERDHTRVIHCPAFRRLQSKTQILGTDEGDFHRTRLTHSLEVASIGKSIIRNFRFQDLEPSCAALFPNDDLISVICLLHDIGHPPFGHGGEVALNFMMRDEGGFEANGQTLRLLTKVENSYGPYGLDLTRRSLLGLLKYPVAMSVLSRRQAPEALVGLNKTIQLNQWLPAKGYFDSEQPEVDWILEGLSTQDRGLFQSLRALPKDSAHGRTAYHSFDCSIMDVADDIAYGVHDLEDAIHLRLIERAQLDSVLLRELMRDAGLSQLPEVLLDGLFSPILHIRKQAIGEMVNYFITATQIVEQHPDFEAGLLKYKVDLLPEAKQLIEYLQRFIYDTVIDSQEARTFEHGGQMVVLRLFEAISANPIRLLDPKNRQLYEAGCSEQAGLRVVCDYIANMTDEYAYRMHERLFGFNTRTIFERL